MGHKRVEWKKDNGGDKDYLEKIFDLWFLGYENEGGRCERKQIKGEPEEVGNRWVGNGVFEI